MRWFEPMMDGPSRGSLEAVGALPRCDSLGGDVFERRLYAKVTGRGLLLGWVGVEPP